MPRSQKKALMTFKAIKEGKVKGTSYAKTIELATRDPRPLAKKFSRKGRREKEKKKRGEETRYENPC